MFSAGQNTTCVNRWVSLYQGCILSGILFSVCTDNILCNGEDMSLFKYADDMALVSHMRNSNVQAQPVEQVQAFRYLDIDLVFSQHTDTTYKKKSKQRIHLLGELFRSARTFWLRFTAPPLNQFSLSIPPPGSTTKSPSNTKQDSHVLWTTLLK